MQKTDIPWADYSINPVKGLCPMDCKDLEGKPYCYARKMYRRFKWNTEIRFDFASLDKVGEIEVCKVDPQRIFVGSTIELFGDWVNADWLELIFSFINDYPQHTFIFLTKQPQNLIKWSPFPENCWVGVSVTNLLKFKGAVYYLSLIDASVRFVSAEPLLGEMAFNEGSIARMKATLDWLILGSRTQPVKHPPREWVDEIISAADKAGIPIFVKEPMASHFGIDRKEFPVK